MRTTTVFGAIFLLALVPVSAGDQLVAPFGQSAPPSRADLDWVERHLAAARDSVMPLRGLQYREYVAFRTSKDMFTDRSEVHFAISFPEFNQLVPTAGNFEATVTTPVGGSVRSQLLQLYLADQDASLDSLLSRVGIRRTRLTLDRCPALKSRTDELLKISVQIPKRRQLFLHPADFRIVIGLNGVHLSASFDDPDQPLVRWALDTLDALNKCAAV